MFKGVLIGTVLVSIFYAFLDESLRFSRAIVLLGAGVSFISFYFSRWLTHLVKERNPFMGQVRTKRMIIVGGEQEANRVNGLLEHVGVQHEVIGLVSPGEVQVGGYLGSIRQLDDIINIHRIDEVIFCSKDIRSEDIFNAMLSIKNSGLSYKIVPEESVFIIGSNSKNEPGDYYTIDVKLALKSPEHQFNKRLLDLTVSAALLLLLPLVIWGIEKRSSFIKNLFGVFSGKLSWVGYSSGATNEQLPHLRRGVLKPVDNYKGVELEVKAINRIDMAYARNYHFTKDLEIILKSINRLGADA